MKCQSLFFYEEYHQLEHVICCSAHLLNNIISDNSVQMLGISYYCTLKHAPSISIWSQTACVYVPNYAFGSINRKWLLSIYVHPIIF